MDQLSKVLFCMLLLALASCGVKGRPLPPLIPPTLGRGEPTYSEVTKKKPTSKKSQSNSADEDETPYPEEER